MCFFCLENALLVITKFYRDILSNIIEIWYRNFRKIVRTAAYLYRIIVLLNSMRTIRSVTFKNSYFTIKR